MKYSILFILLLSSLAISAELKYKDAPTTLDEKNQSITDAYKEQAVSRLSYFNEKFQAKSGRIFFVVTRLYSVDGNRFEQIFVKVKKIEDGTYIGTIASDPLGKVKFKSGDAIKVETKDVVDWSIVMADGSEEGNLQGKVLDLVQAGKAAFISKMVPKDGKYASFTVVSVLNPLTKQEIIEIVPKTVLADVEKYLLQEFDGKAADTNEERFTYTIVQFPEWKIILKN